MRNKFKLLIILVTIIFILPLAMPVFAASSGVTVTSSVGYYPNGNSPMSRLSFYANTRLWDFYFVSNNSVTSSVYFKTSTDNGATWSGATELDMEADISLTPSSYGGYFAVWSDGTHAHFAVTDDGDWHDGGGLV